MILDNSFLKFKNNNFEFNYFYLGLFLLPSLPLISSTFFLIVFISLSLKKKSYFKDVYNFPFFISAILIIQSCLFNSFSPNNFYKDEYSINQIWVGIFNWIPYFWIFWLFQDFSVKKEMRRKIILIFLAGSIPVIISGFMQYFFKFHGPFVFLNGLITWYSREIEPGDGMTGIFIN